MINYCHIRYINYLENYRKRKKKIIVKTSLNKIFWIAIRFDRNDRLFGTGSRRVSDRWPDKSIYKFISRQRNANRAGCCFWRTQKELAEELFTPQNVSAVIVLSPPWTNSVWSLTAWQRCSVQPKTVNSQRFWTLGLEGLIFSFSSTFETNVLLLPLFTEPVTKLCVTAMRATMTELLFFGVN